MQITAEISLKKNMLANFTKLCKISYKNLYIYEISILVNVVTDSGKDQRFILTLNKGLNCLKLCKTVQSRLCVRVELIAR